MPFVQYHLATSVRKSPCPQQQICKEDKESRVAYALSAFVEFKEIALCCLLAAA